MMDGSDQVNAQEVHPHQPEDWELRCAEALEDDLPRDPVRNQADAHLSVPRGAQKGVKRPRSEIDAPDLATYFDDFQLSDKERVDICRKYANYLVACNPQLKKGY